MKIAIVFCSLICFIFGVIVGIASKNGIMFNYKGQQHIENYGNTVGKG